MQEYSIFVYGETLNVFLVEASLENSPPRMLKIVFQSEFLLGKYGDISGHSDMVVDIFV